MYMLLVFIENFLKKSLLVNRHVQLQSKLYVVFTFDFHVSAYISIHLINFNQLVHNQIYSESG